MKGFFSSLQYCCIVLIFVFEVGSAFWAETNSIATRTKRNANNLKYIVQNKSITLQCLKEMSTLNQELIDSYAWRFSDGYTFTEDEIKEYEDIFRRESGIGDITLLQPIANYTSAECRVNSNNQEITQMKYELKLARNFDNAAIKINGTTVQGKFQGIIGRYHFECEAMGDGDPLPNSITLFFNKEKYSSTSTSKYLKIELVLDASHNGAELRCEVDHISRNLTALVNLDVLFPPMEISRNAIDDKSSSADITISYKANPLATYTWAYSDISNCSDRRSLENSTNKIQVKAGSNHDTYSISLSSISDEDKKQCYILTLRNSVGTTELVLIPRGSEGPSGGWIALYVILAILLGVAVAGGLVCFRRYRN